MDEKDVKEYLENIPPEERAEAWEKYVRTEVNSLLDTFLPESIFGNVGIKYDYLQLGRDAKTGKMKLDKNVATGVFLSIMFEYAAPIAFSDEKPENTE